MVDGSGAVSGAMSSAGRALQRLAALVSNGATGVIWLRASTWLRIELVHGWVHAYAGVEAPAEPEQLAAAARRQLRGDAAEALRLLLGTVLFAPPAEGAELVESDEARARLGAVTPFHPARVLRALVEEQLARVPDGVALVDRRLPSDRPLSLAAPFHPSGLDPDEQRLVILLGGTPLRLAELLARGGAPEVRARRLLRSLLVLGALHADGSTLQVDLATLLAESAASEEARRRAYHAAAREVHPDLHPRADETERAVLTDQMAELASRRRRGEP